MSVVACIAPERDPGGWDPAWESDDWKFREFRFDGELTDGARGPPVRRLQELLVLNDQKLAVDGDFGPATRHAVTQFQLARGLVPTGVFDAASHDLLIQPLVRVMRPVHPEGLTLSDLVVRYAHQHLQERPRAIGGENRGPWVRLYMRGREIPERPWSTGLVCFLLRQAAETLGVAPPLDYTFCCNLLAEAASLEGLFVSGSQLDPSGRVMVVRPGSLFLLRKEPGRWIHAGIVAENQGDCFVSIEGNDEDDHDRHRICRQVRGFKGKDFVVFD